MKTSLLTRSVLGVAALGSVASVMTLTPPAQAAPVPPPGIVITAAGSDTTDDLMTSIMTGQTGNTYKRNIRALPAGPQLIEGDANCTDLTYVSPPAVAPNILAPNGSSNGRNALAQTGTNPAGAGCIDIARSSAGPRPISANEPATFEYYAFAFDAMGWASPSLSAPGTMTKQQFKDIYNCVITNWSQLPGGGSGPIQRYVPQTGSGTYGFFLSDLMDGTVPPTGVAGCPDPVFVQENTGNAVVRADFQKAIMPYSTGQWAFQANNATNPTIDKRGQSKLGGFTTATTNANTIRWNTVDGGYELNTGNTAATPVNEANVKLNTPVPDFPGVRYMFNVVNSVHVNYTAARDVVGFDNVAGGAKSPLCSNANAGQIRSFGFAPLNTSNTFGKNAAASNCRRYTP